MLLKIRADCTRKAGSGSVSVSTVTEPVTAGETWLTAHFKGIAPWSCVSYPQHSLFWGPAVYMCSLGPFSKSPVTLFFPEEEQGAGAGVGVSSLEDTKLVRNWDGSGPQTIPSCHSCQFRCHHSDLRDLVPPVLPALSPSVPWMFNATCPMFLSYLFSEHHFDTNSANPTTLALPVDLHICFRSDPTVSRTLGMD